MFIVMELCQGDLSDYLKSMNFSVYSQQYSGFEQNSKCTFLLRAEYKVMPEGLIAPLLKQVGARVTWFLVMQESQDFNSYLIN